jgi:hypothetical protein
MAVGFIKRERKKISTKNKSKKRVFHEKNKQNDFSIKHAMMTRENLLERNERRN